MRQAELNFRRITRCDYTAAQDWLRKTFFGGATVFTQLVKAPHLFLDPPGELTNHHRFFALITCGANSEP